MEILKLKKEITFEGTRYTELDLSGLEEGSPPRVRGKVIVTGNHWLIEMDHPRVCGEKG